MHAALEVVGYELLRDGLFHGAFDEAGGFSPAEEVEEHDAGEHDAAGVDDVLVSVLGGSAVGGLEDGVAVTDVAAGGYAETAYLRGGGVGDVVAVEVGGG